jgi:hypothetical protein
MQLKIFLQYSYEKIFSWTESTISILSIFSEIVFGSGASSGFDSTLQSSIVADFFTIVSFFSARLQFLWVEKVKYPRNFVDIYTNSDWNMKIWTSEHIFW